MIILFRGSNPEQRLARMFGKTAASVVECSPGTPISDFAEQLGARLAQGENIGRVVMRDVRPAGTDAQHALAAIARIVKFAGIDLVLIGDASLERFVDRVVTDDDPVTPPAPPEDEAMTGFERAPPHVPSLREIQAMTGWSRERAKAHQAMVKQHKVWTNNLYQVNIEPVADKPMAHLIIRRRDGRAIHNWRHFQAIKNELVGPECEAVEMYPAESHLVDAKDHYHLWAYTSPEHSFGVGFRHGREVKDEQ